MGSGHVPSTLWCSVLCVRLQCLAIDCATTLTGLKSKQLSEFSSVSLGPGDRDNGRWSAGRVHSPGFERFLSSHRYEALGLELLEDHQSVIASFPPCALQKR